MRDPQSGNGAAAHSLNAPIGLADGGWAVLVLVIGSVVGGGRQVFVGVPGFFGCSGWGRGAGGQVDVAGGGGFRLMMVCHGVSHAVAQGRWRGPCRTTGDLALEVPFRAGSFGCVRTPIIPAQKALFFQRHPHHHQLNPRIQD
jgi:hypothetical protein